MHKDTVIIIPARLGSTRLKEKAIQIIGDKTMIEHTYLQAAKLGLAHLVVATDSDKISDIIENIGGRVVMTSESCESGTDRAYEALQAMDNKDDIEYIINLQGDLPFIDSSIILDMIDELKNSDADIITIVTKVDESIAKDPSNVKVVISKDDRALYFSRSVIPHNAEEYWYHIGIYGYRTRALKKFIALGDSPLEKTEKLEQLRALENGMEIKVCYANSIPISVDTPSDLEKVRKLYTSSF